MPNARRLICLPLFTGDVPDLPSIVTQVRALVSVTRAPAVAILAPAEGCDTIVNTAAALPAGNYRY